MKITTKYDIGEIVYFKLSIREEDPRGIVTGFLVRGSREVEYEVTWADRDKTWHTGAELVTQEEYSNFKVINGL